MAKNVVFSGSIFILEILLFQSKKIKIGYYFKIYANDQAVYYKNFSGIMYIVLIIADFAGLSKMK